jgi:hypothetical protein
MPFRRGQPLDAVERRRVAALWSIAGATLGGAWLGVFALILGLSLGQVLMLGVVIVVGGALFFGTTALLLLHLLNRTLTR